MKEKLYKNLNVYILQSKQNYHTILTIFLNGTF